jgi:hypothetical protein
VGDEQVIRLHVAMDDAERVRGGETLRRLPRELDGFRRRQGAALQSRAQRLPFQQLAHEIRRAVVNTHVVNGEDVGVVQLAGRARFLLEAVHAPGVGPQSARDQLDRDVPAETRVARAIDLAHAAGAQPTDNLVGSDPGAGGERAVANLQCGSLKNPVKTLRGPWDFRRRWPVSYVTCSRRAGRS